MNDYGTVASYAPLAIGVVSMVFTTGVVWATLRGDLKAIRTSQHAQSNSQTAIIGEIRVLQVETQQALWRLSERVLRLEVQLGIRHPPNGGD